MNLPSNEVQMQRLHAVGVLVAKAGCNAALVTQPGDVVALTARGPSEVVAVIDGYDIWQGDVLAHTGVSVEVAAQTLIDEYRANPWPIKGPG